MLQAIIGDFHVAAVTHFEPLGANPFCSFGAPDAERPFATAYYPAAENESEAAVVKVVRSSPLRLSPLRLRKLEVVTIKINVLWADGTRPERSNLYFKNILYPRGVGPCRRSITGFFLSIRPQMLRTAGSEHSLSGSANRSAATTCSSLLMLLRLVIPWLATTQGSLLRYEAYNERTGFVPLKGKILFVSNSVQPKGMSTRREGQALCEPA